MAELDYADSEKVVFHYFDGLFVYDYNKEEIIREFDLSKLNCASHQQGSNGINIIVSSDGKKALIANYGPADEIEDFENYIINLENGKVK